MPSRPSEAAGAGRSWPLLALLCALPLALGARWPDPWWGAHAFAFLPAPWGPLTFLLAAAIGLLFAALSPRAGRLGDGLAAALRSPLTIALLVAIAYALLCHALDMATDIYGDARRNLAAVDAAVARGNPSWARGIFDPDLLFREGGDHLAIQSVALIAAGLGLPAREAFGLFNATFGLIFAFAWTLLVLRQLSGQAERLLLVPVGLGAGFMPLFTNHGESYAPALAMLLLWLAGALRCVRIRTRGGFWLLPPLFLLAAKTHFANLLLAVPLIVVAVDHFAGRTVLLTRRRMLAFVAAPLFAVFLALYFIGMGNHAVSRFVDDVGRARTFFLPLVDIETNGAPNYTLLSLGHALDYLNIVLLWSLPALFLSLAALGPRHAAAREAPPEQVLGELVLLVYAGVFFATNPVIGMPRDWDLFMFPAVPLLVWTLLLVRGATRRGPLPRPLIGAAAGLLVLSLPSLAIHFAPAALAPRLESLGVITYQRYWKGGGYLLNVAAEYGDPDQDTELRRRVDSYRRIKPFALDADAQLADLAVRISHLYRQRGEYGKARPYARDAFVASRGNEFCMHEFAFVQFGNGEYGDALLSAQALLELQPENAAYLDLGVKSAYKAGNWELALELGERYRRLRPRDPAVADLLRAIRRESGRAPRLSP